ncbi:MAG: tetratricopeptide repeat protein [Pyrinomonadaceae bacterium]
MIGQTVSHYRIIERLGEGGMGVVYIAEDTVLGRRVAIKTLTNTSGPASHHFRSRFLREARAVSALSHPHIATVHDYGETPDGQPYIVMEFVKGQTLGELMLKDTLTIPRALEIIIQVAEALAEAHHHGIVHRDIKPSNVALNERGNVKVLDFGLAKQIQAGVADSADPERQTLLNTQTREGVIVGTPMYLSPEQALGIEVDARSDLFSLGGLLYECIAGKPPFVGGSPVEICAKVIQYDPPPPSLINTDVSSELDRITLKSLAKKPESRYQTADELINDLRTALANLNTRASNPTVTHLNSPAAATRPTSALATLSDIFRRPRLSVGYVVAGLVLIGIFGLGAYRLMRPKPHLPSPESQRLYDHAVDSIREGAFFKASKLLQQAIHEDDQFALAHARLAEAWTELDFSDKAKDELIRANDLVPDRTILPPVEGMRLQAITNTVKRDFVKAVEDYRNIVASVADSEKTYALVDLGRAHEKNEETNKAIEQYQEATRRDPNYPAAFLRLGFVLRRSQKFDDAGAAYNKAYRLFDTSNEIEGMAEVSYQRGILLSQQGKVAEAKAQFEQALNKSAALDNQDQRIKILLQLSNISIVAGEAGQAAQYSQQALELAQASGIENLATAGLIDIGNSYFVRGSLPEAERNFNEALRLAQNYKGKRNEARALLSLASLRTHQSNPSEAAKLVELALPFFQQGGYRKETSQAYAILGHAYDQLGKYEAALQAFGDQLKLAHIVGDPQQIALSHEGMGVVLNHQQNYPAAFAHFNAQYEIAKTLGNKLVLGYALMNRGRMLWQLGHYDEGESLLAEAQSVAENSGHEPYRELLAWIRVSKAQLNLSKRNLLAATTESQNALKLAGTDFKTIAVQAGSTLGLAQALSGQNAVGRKRCEGAAALAKTLSDPLPQSQALLAVAMTALAAGDTKTALANAKQAQEWFSAAKQYQSEWQAWLIQANAEAVDGNTQGASEAASRASSALANLERQWGSENYRFFLTRIDVRELQEQAAKQRYVK